MSSFGSVKRVTYVSGNPVGSDIAAPLADDDSTPGKLLGEAPLRVEDGRQVGGEGGGREVILWGAQCHRFRSCKPFQD